MGHEPSRLILIVEDDARLLAAMELILKREGYEVETAGSAEAALKLLGQRDHDVLITDLKLPGIDGMELMRSARKYRPEMSIIMTTAYATVDSAVQAMKEGAEDYVAKPFNLDEIRIIVRKVFEKREILTSNRLLQSQLGRKYAFENIVGGSEGMVEVYKLITRVKDSRSTVLILGETGTGKEMVARAIHFNSIRSGRLFLPVNCGALQENLLASELFGYVKGSFTGAHRDKRGIFEVAEGGTVFLDEIGDVGLGFQQNLLRVLDSGEIQPIGATTRRRVDVRIIAATNRDLEALAAAGEFREDLYYRLNVITIRVPPLRERREDIAPLAHYFLKKNARAGDKSFHGVSADALRLLEAYPWPGNVRELENIMERAALLENGSMIGTGSLPEKLHRPARPPDREDEVPDIRSLPTLESLEKAHILKVLKQTRGNKAQAARILGVNRSTLWRMMMKHSIEDGDIFNGLM